MVNPAADYDPAWDRAVSYGDGLFETVAVFDGRPPLWSFHRQRLVAGMERLGLDADVTQLEQEFLLQAASQGNAVGKIILARSGGPRGYDPRRATQVVWSIRFAPVPTYSLRLREPGVRLQVCSRRLSSNPLLAGIKHLNRLEQVMAATEINPDWADDGLLLDATGAVIECIASNVLIVRDGSLLTPSLATSGVAGVMRSFLIEQVAKELAIPVREERLTLVDVLASEAVFVCNSVMGVRPVQSIGVSSLSQCPSVSARLFEAVDALGYGRLYG